MSCVRPFLGDSPVHRCSPATRILAATAFATATALATRGPALLAALALALIAAEAARLPRRALCRRLAGVNVFFAACATVLPFSVAGEPLFAVGGAAFSREGLELAAAVAARGNAVVLAFTALVSTLDPAELARGLCELRLPKKLALLLLFCARYVEVLHREAMRLERTLRLRCFRPSPALHACRTYGNYAGMLLVNAFERSGRIAAAMRCRGFTGSFPAQGRSAATRRDAALLLLAACACTALFFLETA